MQSCSEPTIENAKKFDLSAEPNKLLLEKPIRDKTVLQSFAFDNINKHIYTLQVMAGGQQLPEENTKASWSTRSSNGDLTLTKLEMDGGQQGYMHLKGFGHGVAMGVEMEDKEPYIWMETNAESDGENAWGSELIRFPFKNEKIIDAQENNFDVYSPIPGADHTTVNIDQAYGLLTIRYQLDQAFHFAVFSLEDIKSEDDEPKPLYDILQPRDIQTFQGFASHGHYLYLLEGDSFENTDDEGNTYISVINLKNELIAMSQSASGPRY